MLCNFQMIRNLMLYCLPCIILISFDMWLIVMLNLYLCIDTFSIHCRYFCFHRGPFYWWGWKICIFLCHYAYLVNIKSTNFLLLDVDYCFLGWVLLLDGSIFLDWCLEVWLSDDFLSLDVDHWSQVRFWQGEEHNSIILVIFSMLHQ